MKFPHTEAEVVALAQSVINGLQGNPNFPSPPYPASEVQDALTAFLGAGNSQTMYYAGAEQSTQHKNTAFQTLVKILKSDLHYAEDAVEQNDAKLSALGWAARATPTPHLLLPPGQPQNVRVTQQEEATVVITWEEPPLGGAVAYYEVELYVAGETSFRALAGTSMETEITLNDQERGKVLAYRVVSVNKAGKSLPSNTVMVVL